MFPAKQPSTPPRSGVAQSTDGVATVVAIVATFFVSPMLFQFSIGWVQQFAVSQYGASATGIATLLWIVACGAGVYWAAFGFAADRQIKNRINNLIR